MHTYIWHKWEQENKQAIIWLYIVIRISYNTPWMIMYTESPPHTFCEACYRTEQQGTHRYILYVDKSLIPLLIALITASHIECTTSFTCQENHRKPATVLHWNDSLEKHTDSKGSLKQFSQAARLYPVIPVRSDGALLKRMVSFYLSLSIILLWFHSIWVLKINQNGQCLLENPHCTGYFRSPLNRLMLMV